MPSWRRALAVLTSVLASGGALAACGSVRTTAPPPTASIVERPVDAHRIFSGVWYDYGQIPARGAPACTLEAVEFREAADGDLFERDFCRGARGARRQSEGRLDIENPGLDTKYTVRERVMAGFYVPKRFVILAHGPNYHWFVRAAPEEGVNVFTRDPEPSAELLARVGAALQALGMDPGRLAPVHPEANLDVLKSEALRP